MWMVEGLDSSKPVYKAVVEAIERDVQAGKLLPGQRMPTHQELADMLGVSTGTANRIYRDAEQRGMVSAVVGRGTYVTVNAGQKHSVIKVSQTPLALDMGISRPMSQTEPDLWAIIRKSLNKRRLPDLMRYVNPQGLEEHRAAGADWLAHFGLTVPPKNVLITVGAQHALSLVCGSLLKPGDRIAADSLTFLGMKVAAQRNRLRLEGVPMDSAGMLPDELDLLCSRQHIKALYISGLVQNPTNRMMSDARREDLRDVIHKHGLLLIENNSYDFLSSTPNKNLASMLPEDSIYISGLSKIFAAGLRIAYVAASSRHIKRLTRGLADNLLCASPVCAEIAAECLRSGEAEASIQKKRDVVIKRVAMFRKIFTNHRFESLDESLCVWLKLPEPWRGTTLEAAAAKRNIRIFSSTQFAVGTSPPEEAVRVSLTGVESQTALRKGLYILERLISNSPEKA